MDKTSGSSTQSSLSAAALIVILSIVANFKSLGCSFFADDLLCLDYFYKIFHGQPDLFWHRLVSPWQDPSISLLYRPFCDVLFAADYTVWQANAFGYHLTNLFLHCGTAVMAFFLVKRACWQLGGTRPCLLALLSASIFAVYPIHVEAIAWLVCRADLAAAFFLLAALLLATRDNCTKLSLAAALAAYFGALFSKEASACAPAILLAYFMLVAPERLGFKQALIRIIPFICVTAVYFAIRYAILGTLIGGYTGSLGEALKWHRLQQIFNFDLISLLALGANLALFKENSPTMIALRIIYLALAAVLIIRIRIAPWGDKEGRIVGFFAAAMAAAFVPAIPVLGISGVLTNSRVFYLASVFYIPLIVTAVIPSDETMATEAHQKFLRKLVALSVLATGFSVVIFAMVSDRTYTPWLEGSTTLHNLQSAVHEALVQNEEKDLKDHTKRSLVVIFPFANLKGAHLLYEFNELKTLVGANFFNKDLSENMIALDEYPDFHSGSTARLQRLLADPAHYDVEFFNFDKQRLNHVVASAANSASRSGSKHLACFLSPTASPDKRDKAYWITLPVDAQIDDCSQLELIINWKTTEAKRLCSFLFSTRGRIPQESDLMGSVGNFRKRLAIYHISTFELRKIVCGSPANEIYIQMPINADLLSAYLIPGDSTALLQPDLSSLKELHNGNYLPGSAGVPPASKKAYLLLDVSKVPTATNMILERAEPNYLFKMTKTGARDPQSYDHLAKTIRFNSTREKYELPLDELKPGTRHAFRLIALDKDGHYTGFYSDTVSVDLRSSAH